MPAMCAPAEAARATPPSGGMGAAAGGMGSGRGAVHSRTRCTSDAGDSQLRQLFASFDANGDNVIDTKELASAMEKLGLARGSNPA